MKYINNLTGQIYTGGILTINSNGVLFSGIPSTDQLLSWGFEEYIPSENLELTQEQLLSDSINEKLNDLNQYDHSSTVNSFTINGQQMWLNVEERQQLATQINANEVAGRTEMTRWFNGVSFTFPINIWKQMLNALELYAGDALNVTEGHKAAIKSLTEISQVESYDFTIGYPEKLNFGTNNIQ